MAASRLRSAHVDTPQNDARTSPQSSKPIIISDHRVTTSAEIQVSGHGSALSGTLNPTPQAA